MSNYRSLEISQLAEKFKALSHPHRLSIFLRLAKQCSPGQLRTPAQFRTCVGELGEGLGITPSTVSHHIKELRRAGLIRMQRQGKRKGCYVEPSILKDLARLFTEGGK
jgi:ArsR family transcriptional regulator